MSFWDNILQLLVGPLLVNTSQILWSNVAYISYTSKCTCIKEGGRHDIWIINPEKEEQRFCNDDLNSISLYKRERSFLVCLRPWLKIFMIHMLMWRFKIFHKKELRFSNEYLDSILLSEEQKTPTQFINEVNSYKSNLN